MNSSQLQNLIAKIKEQSSAHKLNTANLKANAYMLKQNVGAFSEELIKAERKFAALTNNEPQTAAVKYLIHPQLKLTGS